MSKIIDEIKKISKDNEYDLSKFDSVYDLIAEMEEEKINKEIELENIKNDAEKTKKNYEKLEKENQELTEKEKNYKQEIVELKIKYVDRFNEPIIKNNKTNNVDITISDLFKNKEE